MASLIDDLNHLLARERGEVEALQALLRELKKQDPDLADTARDMLDIAGWSCRGLYHRIVHLNGVPTIEIDSSLADKIADSADAQSMLDIMCKAQKKDLKAIKSILKNDLDDDTRMFLNDLLRAHEQVEQWCEGMLDQWKPDSD